MGGCRVDHGACINVALRDHMGCRTAEGCRGGETPRWQGRTDNRRLVINNGHRIDQSHIAGIAHEITVGQDCANRIEACRRAGLVEKQSWGLGDGGNSGIIIGGGAA